MTHNRKRIQAIDEAYRETMLYESKKKELFNKAKPEVMKIDFKLDDESRKFIERYDISIPEGRKALKDKFIKYLTNRSSDLPKNIQGLLDKIRNIVNRIAKKMGFIKEDAVGLVLYGTVVVVALLGLAVIWAFYRD